MYHASQQTVSADGLQDNSQHRKMRGIKSAICAPSIRPDPCIWSRGFSGTCRRASLRSFRGCDPGVVNSCLVDLLIEPMPLERLSKKGDTPTFQLRSGEEVRLRALAGETLHLHGGVES